MDSASEECAARPVRKRVRTISNLTEEQIRKKRGNDREAQRAVRERTKSRIHTLEQELATLRSEQTHSLSSLTKEIQELRRENQHLKCRLRRAHELTALDGLYGLDAEEPSITVGCPDAEEPVTNQGTNLDTSNNEENENNIDPSLTDTETAQAIAVQQSTPQEEPHDAPATRSSVYNDISGMVTVSDNPHQQQSFMQQRLPVEGSRNNTEITSNESDEPHRRGHTIGDYNHSETPYSNVSTARNIVRSGDFGGNFSPNRQESVERQSTSFPRAIIQDQYAPVANQTHFDHSSSDSAARNSKWGSEGRDFPDFTRSQQLWPGAYESTTSDEYLDGVISGTRGLQAAPIPSHEPITSPEAISPCWVEPQANSLSRYSIIPKHLAATCPLDQILLDFLSSRRHMAAQGTPISALVGPSKPAVSGLLNPRFKTMAHASSRVIVDIVCTFTDTGLTEKLGFLCIMYATMRWQIACDRESYENLPSWLHPTVLQVVVPHAAWIDNIPWPHVRDVLIQNPNKYTFRDFSEMYARCARLNWPYKAMDAVIPIDSTGEVSLNPLFEKHALSLQCWSVGEQFKERFPELAAEMRS